MTVNPDLYRASSEPEAWQRLVDEINVEFKAIDKDAARRRPSATLSDRDAETQRITAIEPARKALSAAVNAQWGGYRMHYTIGQLDTDILTILAERRHIGWQDIFNAKAAFGTADDLALIQRQAQLAGTTVNPSHALPHAAKPLQLVNGLRHEGNIGTTEYLFRQGADPAQDDGNLFNAVVELGRPDIGRLFARFGQNGVLNMDPHVNNARRNRKFKLFDDLRKIQWEFGRYHVVDNDTLVENKPLPDSTGNLKIIFNFSARRVTEIMELANPKQNVVKDYGFDEYGQGALELARQRLLDAGANPSGIDIPLRGKGSVARPAARGLTSPDGN